MEELIKEWILITYNPYSNETKVLNLKITDKELNGYTDGEFNDYTDGEKEDILFDILSERRAEFEQGLNDTITIPKSQFENIKNFK